MQKDWADRLVRKAQKQSGTYHLTPVRVVQLLRDAVRLRVRALVDLANEVSAENIRRARQSLDLTLSRAMQEARLNMKKMGSRKR